MSSHKLFTLFSHSLKFSFGSFVFLSVINRFLISFRRVHDAQSMSPSFNPRLKDYIVIWKLNYLQNVKKGLTFMNHPLDGNKQVVRFIVALPGEWVKCKKKEMYHKVPDGYCWVECLNGEDDSNTWGPVPIAMLMGRPVVKIRFFSKFVRAKKIEENMRKRLRIDERILDEDGVNEFFL